MSVLERILILSCLGLAMSLAGCGSGYNVGSYVLPQFTGGVPPYALFHAYGDSITYGYRLDKPSTQAYPALVARSNGLALTNYGVPGDHVCDVAPLQIFYNSDNPSLGDHGLYSVMIGTNDMRSDASGAYKATFNLCQQAALTWLAVPVENKVLATAATVTSQGSTSLETANNWNALTTAGQNTIVSFPFAQQAPGTIYLWYRLRNASAGVVRVAIDGQAVATVSASPTPALQTQNDLGNSLGVVRITPVPVGTHLLTVTQLNPGTEGVGIVGLGMVAPGEASSLPRVLVGTLPRTLDPVCGACAVYTGYIRANALLLAADGLNLQIFQSDTYMTGTFVDMVDELHPNATGHQEIAHAVLDALTPAVAAAHVQR